MNILNVEAIEFQETVTQRGQERENWSESLGVTHSDQISRPPGKSRKIGKIDNLGKMAKT